MADEAKICGVRHPDIEVDGAPQIVDKYCTAPEGHLDNPELGTCRFRSYEELPPHRQAQINAKGGKRAS